MHCRDPFFIQYYRRLLLSILAYYTMRINTMTLMHKDVIIHTMYPTASHIAEVEMPGCAIVRQDTLDLRLDLEVKTRR